MKPGARRILVTGATGHIGSIFTHNLLLKKRPNHHDQVTLLVRAASEHHGRERIHAAFERIDDGNRKVPRMTNAAPPELSTAKIVPFDLATLHTDAKRRDGLAALLSSHGPFTHVMHLAANTSYYASVAAAENMNLHGAVGLLNAVAEVSGDSLQRFCYVSTAWACGKRPAVGSVLQESDYPLHENHQETMAGHFYPYTYSKARAETLLKQRAAELGVSLVVARPSVVIGHRTLGCLVSGSIFFALRAVDRLKEIAWPSSHVMDIVPADWVAECLDALLFAPRLQFDTYHLTAGRRSAVSWEELSRAFAASHPLNLSCGAITTGNRGYSTLPSVDHLLDASRSCWQQNLACCPRSLRRAMRLYSHFAKLSVAFANDRLLASGAAVEPPPNFAELIHTCLTHTRSPCIASQLAEDF